MFDDDIDQLDDVYGRFKRNGGLELRVSRKQYNGSDLVRYTPEALLQRQAYAQGRYAGADSVMDTA